MKNKNIALAGALLIGGLLTFNSIAFADSTTASTLDNIKDAVPFEKALKIKMGAFGHKGEKDVVFIKHQFMEEELKALVTEGTITQATADKIKAFMEEQQNTIKLEKEKLQAMTSEERRAYFESIKPDSKEDKLIMKKDLFSDMVAKGVLTQKEADAIKARMEAIRETKHQEAVKASLNKLVQDKTITQVQADKIAEYMNKQRAAKEAEMEKLQTMTKKELEAYFKDKVETRTNIFAQLVADKVLTQEQADAVAKALHVMGPHMGSKHMVIKKF